MGLLVLFVLVLALRRRVVHFYLKVLPPELEIDLAQAGLPTLPRFWEGEQEETNAARAEHVVCDEQEG